MLFVLHDFILSARPVHQLVSAPVRLPVMYVGSAEAKQYLFSHVPDLLTSKRHLVPVDVLFLTYGYRVCVAARALNDSF